MAEPEVENGAQTPVGTYLRAVREAKGLQLDDASRVTKIGKNYLMAIEEGQFEKLPNAAYIKGFLRLYAGYLSLSGDEVVARYEKAVAPTPAAQAESTTLSHPQSSGAQTGIDTLERAKFRSHGRWAVPALLLAAVVIAALFFSEGEPPRVQTPAPQPRALPPAPAPVPQPVQQQASSARGQAPAPLSGAEALPAPPAAKQSGVVLRLRFTRDSWLGITIDDSISQSYDLKAGDIIEWKGQRSFALDLGDGGAVEGEFNGRPLEPLGEAGSPAHVELKASQTAP